MSETTETTEAPTPDRNDAYVRLSPVYREALDLEAQSQRRSVSWIIRESIYHYLKRTGHNLEPQR